MRLRQMGLFGYGAFCTLCKLFIALVVSTGLARADPLVVVALGDSLTAGYGLPREDGFVPQLQKWLDEQGVEIEVRNAGVSGDTIGGGLARLDWSLTEDVDAMIVALGGNDFLRGVDPVLSRANLHSILSAARDRDIDVLLVGLTASNNYGPDYALAFNSMFQELAEEFDVPLFETFFRGLLDAAETQDRVLEYMQSDGIHPNADGVIAIVGAMGPEIAKLTERQGG